MSSRAVAALPGARERTSAAIEAIWERRRDEIVARIDAIDDAVAALRTGSLDEALRAAAHRAAHQLAGSAGTFGFARASQLARELEHALDLTAPSGVDSVPRLAELAIALRARLERKPAPAAAASTSAPQAIVTLLVVSADRELTDRVRLEATGRGLRVLVAQTALAGRARTTDKRPDVVLLDLDLPGEQQAALEMLTDLAGGANPVPVACVTDAESFADRVEVARRGARGHLSRSLPAAGLVAAIVGLTDIGAEAGPRVLVVDDDPAVLDVVASLLDARGLKVATLADPTHFWDVLERFSPELILLDVEMPHIDGIELCRVLRNDPRSARLPVLFLTARTDPGTVQQIFAAGADDYVAKPIMAAELTTRIANRLERVALYRSLADVDALTGVATRRASSEALQRALGMTERHGLPVALAAIDLDNFKAINDRHGHATGDQVLQRLGRLLQTSFRGEDIAARWGGEEFVVGLIGANAADAVQPLTKLLKRFRQESFDGRDGERFSATFSAGVAAAPNDGRDLETLYRAADRALYQAKARGRDRVLSHTCDAAPRQFAATAGSQSTTSNGPVPPAGAGARYAAQPQATDDRGSRVSDHDPQGERRAAPTVLIADDDIIVRELLCAQLAENFHIVAEAADADDAIALAHEHQPDIAIVDVQMPGGGAPKAVRGIRAAAPNAAIVVLSTDESETQVRELIHAGAITYLRKGIAADELSRCLQESLHAQASLGYKPPAPER